MSFATPHAPHTQSEVADANDALLVRDQRLERLRCQKAVHHSVGSIRVEQLAGAREDVVRDKLKEVSAF